jgi:hypothetical protein
MPRHPPCALSCLISNRVGVFTSVSMWIPHSIIRSFNCQRAKQVSANGRGHGVRATPENFRATRQARPATRCSRKEVIQPQVPLRLPCYDFAPVTELTFGGYPLAVGAPTSGPPSFHGVTGGVYKARERIHRGVADPRLLAIPASCGRVADHNPNLDRLLAISALLRVGDALYRPL